MVPPSRWAALRTTSLHRTVSLGGASEGFVFFFSWAADVFCVFVCFSSFFHVFFFPGVFVLSWACKDVTCVSISSFFWGTTRPAGSPPSISLWVRWQTFGRILFTCLGLYQKRSKNVGKPLVFLRFSRVGDILNERKTLKRPWPNGRTKNRSPS